MRETYTKTIDNEKYKIEFYDEALEYKTKNPYLFSVFIKYDGFYESQAGYEEFLETKESLIIAIEYEDSAKYVGSRVIDGWSELYFYTSTLKGFNATVSAILSPSHYVYESNIVKDAKWDFYETQLFPTELESHHIVSQKIISLLKEENDNTQAIREVEHYAVFDTDGQKERFKENTLKSGFLYKDDISTEEYDYGIALVKEHNIEETEVEKVVNELYKLIKKEHGYYEGWSTTLVNQES